MPRLTDLQVLLPSDDDTFEDLCCELWKRIWKDPTAQRNGRNGQSQNGVDVSGRPNDGADYEGVQCKAITKPLTEKELQKEIDSAKGFDPPLKSLIVATTAPKDAKLEQYARNVTQQHVQNGLFPVTVLGAKDVLTLLERHPDLVEEYTEASVQSTAVAHAVIQAFDSRFSAIQEKIADHSEVHIRSFLTRQLDEIRDAVNERRPNEALRRLTNFRQRHWSEADDLLRFRVAFYEGEAHLALGEETEAAQRYLEAYGHKPDEEAAVTRLALAHLVSGDNAAAARIARDAIARYPGSTLACAVLLNALPPDADLDQVLEQDVPSPIRHAPEVLMNLAIVYNRRGETEKAEHWVRVAVEAATAEPGHPNLLGLYGSILLTRAIERRPTILSLALTDAETQRLAAEAEAGLTQAWELVKDTDLAKEHVGWLVNRAGARRLLGRKTEMVADLEEALRLVPDRPDVMRCRALAAFEGNDRSRASELLVRCLNIVSAERVDASILLARVLASDEGEDKEREALAVLSRAETYSLSPDQRIEILELRADVALMLGENDIAREAVGELLNIAPQRVAVFTIAARLARRSNEAVSVGTERLTSAQLLQEAQKRLTDDTLDVERFDLASELFQSGMYQEAAQQYAALAVPGHNDDLSRRLLWSYYQSGNLGGALEVATQLLETNGPLPMVSELATAISEEIGALTNARRFADDFAAAFPNDLSMQLRRATICARQGDAAPILEFLARPLTPDGMGVRDAILVSSLYERFGTTEQALRFSYAVREKFYDEGAAHLAYVNLFFRLTTREHLPLLDVMGGADIDHVVVVDEEHGVAQTYWIEEEPFRHDEFHLTPQHPLACLLLGKSGGEKATLNDHSPQVRELRIKDVKSKFVQAFHESSDNYQRWFPGQGGLWMMHVREIPDDAPDVEDARRREFRPLFDVIDEMDKHRQNIEKQYRQRNLTIGLASELMGHDILTMWAGLSQIPEAGIRCAVGNRAALDKAVQGLGDRPQLVIDPLGLITLYHLPCRDELLAFCGPLITSQSVRDEFLKIAESRRADTPQGFTTITRQKIGSGYTAVEFPAEAVAEHAAQAQALRDWVEANTQVQPVGLLLSKQGGHWKQMRNTLGEAYADPLFIAKEANLLLWTDDDALRQVAEHELGVTGVWSQVVLTRAAQTGAISGEAKEDAVIWLASRNYRYTSVSVETVVRAAEQAAWLPTPQLLSVLRVLGGEYSDLTGIPIAVEAMYELFRKKVPSLRFEALIVALVDSVTRGRNRQATLKRVSTLLSQRFYLAPIHASRIMAIIKAWTIANPI